MHMEFRQIYGSQESDFPQWMKWENLELLPPVLREVVSGKDGGELGGWIQLYRYLIDFSVVVLLCYLWMECWLLELRLKFYVFPLLLLPQLTSTIH